MSSTSIARQKRRKRQRQQNPILHHDSSEPPPFTPSSDHCILNSGSQCGNSPKLSAEKDEINSIRDAGDQEGSFPASNGCSFIKCDISSRPFGKIYVEDERGFRPIDASQLLQTLQNGIGHTVAKTNLAIDLAHNSEQIFHNFSLLCHGLIGGMSFIETLLLIHLVSTSPELEETLQHFQFLSQPIHNLFNFLCIICCISAFDRYDIGNLKQLFKYLKSCKLKAIIIIIYPVCLLLSLSTANVDEKLCLPENNSTTLESFENEEGQKELIYWKTLSISKCIGALVAWIIVSFDQNQNALLHHIRNVILRTNVNSA